MKKKGYIWMILLTLYTLFTVICGCLSRMDSGYGVLMFRIWYLITAAVWIALAVTMAVLLVRLLRLKKLKNEFEKMEQEIKELEQEINHRKG